MAERTRIEAALERASRGMPAAVLVTGEAGVGKTALVDAVLADRRDLVVLRARGREPEAPIPYAALHALLRPLLGCVDQLPGPQAAALEAAFSLRASGGTSDRFAVGAGTLTLLGQVGRRGPDWRQPVISR